METGTQTFHLKFLFRLLERMGTDWLLDLMPRISLLRTNERHMNCHTDSEFTQRTEECYRHHLLYSSAQFLSVWITEGNRACQGTLWRHTPRRKQESQTYFCAETDGRSVSCCARESSFYCSHWIRICCEGSPSGLQVTLWRKERPFYGETDLLNNGKSRSFFF